MDNLRGILLMTAAMAGFAVEDMFIKAAAERLPTGQILIFIGTFGCLAFALAAKRRGARLLSADLLTTPVVLRNVGEVVGTIGFVTGLALAQLSTVSAILQATPLAVTLGAALFLGETVGWRRWTAVGVGFAGVVMILRPGLEGFEPAALYGLLAVMGLGMRDLATRRVPPRIPTVQLAAYAFAALVPAGLFLLAFSGPMLVPSPAEWGLLVGALVCGIVAYYAITAAMRVGEVSVVTPFRYTRLLFALFIGALVFGERPDALMLSGAALVIASGLYTLLRESGLRRRRRPLSSGGPVT